MSTYSEKLKDPRWQKKRLEILQRDFFMCLKCGDGETELHIHHKKYSGKNPWDAPNGDLVTTCKHCHGVIEFIKKHYPKQTILKIVKRPYSTDLVNDCGLFAIAESNDALSIMAFTFIDGVLRFESWVSEDAIVAVFEALKHYSKKSICLTVS